MRSLQIEIEPAPKDIRFFEDRLHDYNVEQIGSDDGKWLSFFVRDDAGGIVAGLHGWTSLFYQKMGYEILHVLDDFPRRPHKLYHLKTALTPSG